VNDKNKKSHNSEPKKEKYTIRCYYPIDGEYVDWEELSEEQRDAARKRMLQNAEKSLKSHFRILDDRE
jgi:hypothetical protein